MTLRERMYYLATEVQGLTAADRDAYLDLVGPHESAAVRQGMLTMYGCALVCRGLLRRLGLRHPRLTAPYRIGMAIADLWEIARQAGALVSPGKSLTERVPQAGDIVLVGGQPREMYGGADHVYTLLGVHVVSPERVELSSVDGGQLRNGKQAIEARDRSWSWRASAVGGVWDRALDTGPGQMAGPARSVRWWIDLERLDVPDTVPAGPPEMG